MARTGSSTVAGTETQVFQSDVNKGGQVGDGPPFAIMRVNCTSASAVPLLARVPTANGTSQITIPIGEAREIVAASGPARKPNGHQLYLQGSGGTATYTWEALMS